MCTSKFISARYTEPNKDLLLKALRGWYVITDEEVAQVKSIFTQIFNTHGVELRGHTIKDAILMFPFYDHETTAYCMRFTDDGAIQWVELLFDERKHCLFSEEPTFERMEAIAMIIRK